MHFPHNHTVGTVVDLEYKIYLEKVATRHFQVGETISDIVDRNVVLLNLLHLAHLATQKVLAEIVTVHNLLYYII